MTLHSAVRRSTYLIVFLLALSGGVALAQFDGAPPEPLRFSQHDDYADFDVQVHDASNKQFFALESTQAQHGPNCSGPPASHENHSYDGAVYVCNNHVMTALNSSTYGLAEITPNRLLDFSTEATIQWQMSTQAMSTRDWPDVVISEFLENIALPYDIGAVSMPRTGVQLEIQAGKTPILRSLVDHAQVLEKTSSDTIQSGIAAGTNQAAVRQTFKITMTRNHFTFERLASETADARTFIDTKITALDFTHGVVQFGHHSYNPKKACTDGQGPCQPATWHWDNFELTPSSPMTFIKADLRYVCSGGECPDPGNKTVSFKSPAPKDAYLRFAAVGRVELSFDGGSSWKVAKKQYAQPLEELASSYFLPIPAGTTKVQVRLSQDDWYQCGLGCIAKDFHIWSLDEPTDKGH